jgi:aspartate racemase
MKTIGLMGGMGWEGSASYYRTMNRQVRASLGGFHSARIILDSLDFAFMASASSKEDFERVRRTLVESALRLEGAGADLLVIACNTVHRMAPSIQEAISIPFLHIADSAGAALVRDGHERVGLLGTKATMEAPFYRKRLASRFSLDVVVPDESVRVRVDRLINQELVSGDEPEASAAPLDEMVVGLAASGCTAVLLACTDFGLAYGSTGEPVLHRELPLYDTAVLHALEAVDFALR